MEQLEVLIGLVILALLAALCDKLWRSSSAPKKKKRPKVTSLKEYRERKDKNKPKNPPPRSYPNHGGHAA